MELSGSDHSFWYRAYKLPSLYPDLFSVIADNYNIYDTGNEINFNENLRFLLIIKATTQIHIIIV